MIEKIRGTHTQITTFGELDRFRNVISRLSLSPTNIQFNSLGDYYEQVAQEFFINLPTFSTEWFTDKTPSNYRFIGLLKNAIPGAKFVYCFAPLKLSAGRILNNLCCHGMSYSFDLDDIVARYNLHSYYMDKWFKLGKDIVICDYESLIDNTEEHLRSLVNQLDLTWEDSLLSHDESKTKSLVRTVSMVQVGIYKGSDSSWKKFDTT